MNAPKQAAIISLQELARYAGGRFASASCPLLGGAANVSEGSVLPVDDQLVFSASHAVCMRHQADHLQSFAMAHRRTLARVRSFGKETSEWPASFGILVIKAGRSISAPFG